jgi:hypothetical protein
MKVIAKGDKVAASAAALLSKLNIKPFAYGIEITKVPPSPAHRRTHLACVAVHLLSNGFCMIWSANGQKIKSCLSTASTMAICVPSSGQYVL